jgi:hypothetical protein
MFNEISGVSSEILMKSIRHSMRKIPSFLMLKLVIEIVPHSTSKVNQLSFICGAKISQQISPIGKLNIISEMINKFEN